MATELNHALSESRRLLGVAISEALDHVAETSLQIALANRLGETEYVAWAAMRLRDWTHGAEDWDPEEDSMVLTMEETADREALRA